MPQLRKDPILKQWVIISPEKGRLITDYLRDDQPGTIEESSDKCPFCEGNEHLTPPEVMAFRKNGTLPNQPGWWIRIVPDSTPIFTPTGEVAREGIGMFDAMNSIGIHEVVVETPHHAIGLHNTSLDQVRELIWAFKQRLLEIKKNPSYKHFLIVKNSGRGLSGFSHSHSHLVAMPIIPKRIEDEIDGAREYFHYHDRCIYCDIVRQEIEENSRIIHQDHLFLIFCPFASRFPFEMEIIPRSHQPFFENINNDHVHGFANVLQIAVKKIHALFPDMPYNFILHSSPCTDSYRDFFHWHLEIVPKPVKISGFEWGSGFYINPVAPEDAAKKMRETTI